MATRSDEQRRAMFARMKSGSGYQPVRWVFTPNTSAPTSKPTKEWWQIDSRPDWYKARLAAIHTKNVLAGVWKGRTKGFAYTPPSTSFSDIQRIAKGETTMDDIHRQQLRDANAANAAITEAHTPNAPATPAIPWSQYPGSTLPKPVGNTPIKTVVYKNEASFAGAVFGAKENRRPLDPLNVWPYGYLQPMHDQPILIPISTRIERPIIYTEESAPTAWNIIKGIGMLFTGLRGADPGPIKGAFDTGGTVDVRTGKKIGKMGITGTPIFDTSKPFDPGANP
jgi:hypothetical protein